MPITAKHTENGYYWRYDHSVDEPSETIDMAIGVAVEVAADQAQKTGKTYYVTSTPSPVSVYIVRYDHSGLSRVAMSVMFEVTAEGDVVRRPRPQRH